MYSRGTWVNFLVGVPIAFFSGVAVAACVLDDQQSALVGVAISASLLPPACNTGIIWVSYYFVVNNMLGINPNASTTEVHNEFRKAGAISLLLAVANIVLIYVASVIVFVLKWVSES